MKKRFIFSVALLLAMFFLFYNGNKRQTKTAGSVACTKAIADSSASDISDFNQHWFR